MLLALLLVARTSFAQESTGSLEGRVMDSLRIPVPGANITVSGPALQGVRGTVTDEKGYFRLVALPVGLYSLRISHVAYQGITYDKISVHLGKTSTLGDLPLASRTAEMPEVTVSGARPLIDARSATTGANIEARTFETLPTDRNFRSIVTLVPSANSSSYIGEGTNISGSTGNENVYFIDGINVTEPLRSSTSADLPYNFVQEVEVKTGGYEAEYASALGGIVNVVTRSGGNDFAGQAFGFFTNNGLTAERRPGLLKETISRFSSYDVGLSLGGPIIRDKVWFYGAYNPSFEDKDVVLPGLGAYPDRKRSQLFAGKLSWQAGENTHAVLSVLGDPSNQDAVNLNSGISALSNPDPILQKRELGGVNVSVQADHMINNKVLIEASVARFDHEENDLPRTERGRIEPLFTDYVTGITSGGTGGFEKNHSTRFSARVSTTVFLGTHTPKVGLEYEDNTLDWTAQNLAGTDDQLPGVVQRWGDTTYVAFQNPAGYANIHNRIPAAFVQDSWHVSDRLRLNAGLRWTGQFFVGSDGKVAQKITDEYQPRFGFTYQLGDQGTQKLYGSYGRFYEQVPLLFPISYYNGGRSGYTITYNHDPRGNFAGGDTSYQASTISPEMSGLQGQYFDEFSLGYERRFGEDLKIGVRGIYRNLLQVIEDGGNPSTGEWSAGNPGSGSLSFLPKFTRQYRALEFTVEKYSREGINFLASYVLSRVYGNYPGLFDGDLGSGNVNSGNTNVNEMDTPDQFLHGDGLLPNDRTHVFKFSSSYAFTIGFSLGVTLVAQSGVPLTEFGSSLYGEPLAVTQRGTAGRTPATWDLNLRAAYSVASFTGARVRPKIIIDVFHVFSQRKALLIDQFRYMGHDDNGNQIAPNPTYGQVQLYQPPMGIRLGMEVNF